MLAGRMVSVSYLHPSRLVRLVVVVVAVAVACSSQETTTPATPPDRTVFLREDFEAAIDRVEALTEQVVIDRRDNGIAPMDNVDIETEYAIALAITMDPWELEFPPYAELAMLMLVDQGMVDAADIPTDFDELMDWRHNTTFEDSTIDNRPGFPLSMVQSTVEFAIIDGLAAALPGE
jgi:hypothetical protein